MMDLLNMLGPSPFCVRRRQLAEPDRKVRYLSGAVELRTFGVLLLRKVTADGAPIDPDGAALNRHALRRRRPVPERVERDDADGRVAGFERLADRRPDGQRASA